MSDVNSVNVNMLPASFVTQYIKSAQTTGEEGQLFADNKVDTTQKSYTKQDFINLGVPQDIIDMYFGPQADKDDEGTIA